MFGLRSVAFAEETVSAAVAVFDPPVAAVVVVVVVVRGVAFADLAELVSEQCLGSACSSLN